MSFDTQCRLACCGAGLVVLLAAAGLVAATIFPLELRADRLRLQIQDLAKAAKDGLDVNPMLLQSLRGKVKLLDGFSIAFSVPVGGLVLVGTGCCGCLELGIAIVCNPK
jgi:hypothetical protein